MSDELAKISDEERAKRQEIERSRSVEGMKKRWQDQDRTEIQTKAAQYAPPVITVGQCHVCQHPQRLFIEQMLVKGYAYSAIARGVPPLPESGKQVDRRSIKNHYENHMNLESAVVRAVLEEEAQLLGQNVEEGISGAWSIRGTLNILMRKAYDDAMAGITTVEPKDLIQMAKLYNEMDSSSSVRIVEEAKASVSIFMTAINNVFADLLEQEQRDELSGAIVKEVQRLREQDQIEAELENTFRRLSHG
jgi:hypothetical protein